MNRHFSYLLDEQSDSFFQKVAMRQAEQVHKVRVPRPEPEPVEKQASSQSGFEKLASRLESDLYIMKTAGACGLGLGMSKRACAYIDRAMDEFEMTPDEFGVFFDKVAAESILVDISSARQELGGYVGFDKTAMAAIDHELAFIGFEMSKLADMEKEAVLAGLRALMSAGRAATGAKMLSGGTKAIGAVKSIPGGIVRGVEGAGKAISGATVKGGDMLASGAGKALRGAKAGGSWAVNAPGRAARGMASKYRQARLGLGEMGFRSIAEASKNPLMTAQTPAGAAYRKSLQGSALKKSMKHQKLMQDPKYQAAAQARREARKLKQQQAGTFQDRKQARTALNEKAKTTETKMELESKRGLEGARSAAGGSTGSGLPSKEEIQRRLAETQRSGAVADRSAMAGKLGLSKQPKKSKGGNQPESQTQPPAGGTPTTPPAPEEPKGAFGKITDAWGKMTPGEKFQTGLGGYLLAKEID